jgi:hypothetical protein
LKRKALRLLPMPIGIGPMQGRNCLPHVPIRRLTTHTGMQGDILRKDLPEIPVRMGPVMVRIADQPGIISRELSEVCGTEKASGEAPPKTSDISIGLNRARPALSMGNQSCELVRTSITEERTDQEVHQGAR